MKKTKVTIVLISILMTTALVLTSLSLAQDDGGPLSENSDESSGPQAEIEDSENQENELGYASGIVRYVLEGSFNVTQDGDVITGRNITSWRWKRIAVPHLTLENMPLIEVYVKPNDRDFLPPWIHGRM